MWSKLWRKKAWRDEDSREALEGPIPEGTEAFPFDAPLGARSTLTFARHVVALSLPSLVIAYLGYVDRLAMVLLAVGLALSLATALYELQTAGRSIHIDEEGIRVRRLFSRIEIPWWHVRGVEMDWKLTSLRIVTNTAVVRLKMSAQPVDRRKQLVLALRARTESRRIPMTVSPSRWFSLSPRTAAFNMAGGVLVFAAVSLTASNTSWALGMRCSAPSQYLRTRFNTAPGRPGCVVLRVSGAAKRAGIRQGDLVLQMNGNAITSGAQFSSVFHKSGLHFSFTVLRPGTPEPLYFDFRLLRQGKAPETPKNDPLFYFLRARWDSSYGKVGAPIADYTKAIELEPSLDLAYLYRGQLYEDLGNQAAAFADYETALRLSPQLGEVQRQMAYVYQNQARRTDSVAAARRALELDGCDTMLIQYNVDCAADYLALAVVLHPSQYRQIARAADRASEFDPSFPEPYFVAAQAYAALGNRQLLAERTDKYKNLPQSKIERAKVSLLDYLLAHPELPPEYPVGPEGPTSTPQSSGA
jgi:tetratricopeptide (TPR) repeat protein